MAFSPATAAQQHAEDAQRAADQTRVRISDLERALKEQQDALAKEKSIYNDQVKTAQQARDNAKRIKAAEHYMMHSAAQSNNPPNPVI